MGMAGTMNIPIEENPARVRFKVYMPVPNAPAAESPVTQAAVDDYVARCDAFIQKRNEWFIDASLRREIERVLLQRRT